LIIKINKRFLTFPVNNNTTVKKIVFKENGRPVYDLDVRLDNIDPCFTAYVDMTPFLGKELEVTVEPDMRISYGEEEYMNIEDLFSEPRRPLVHYTVPNGFNNDPNGLIYKDGVYHLFCQYNPCDTVWGNMHWLHAVSGDMLHWNTVGTALWPDESGTMYSGSAIEDKENITGFGAPDSSPMLLFYTSAGRRNMISGNKQNAQNIAYSLNGNDFVKYSGNPVIETVTKNNRDPKVVYVEELGKFVLALYMEKSRYSLFTSSDLLSWVFLQDIELEGDSECPDIYPLFYDGRKYWVFSGASDFYVVGQFINGYFSAVTPVQRITYSKCSYAAQSYSGIPGRVIRIAWEKPAIPSSHFVNQMSVPVEASLSETGGLLKLSFLPIKEIDKLKTIKHTGSGTDLSGGFGCDPRSGAVDISLKGKTCADAVIRIKAFGRSIIIDIPHNLIYPDTQKDLTMPLNVAGDRLDVRIVIDKCSAEIFSDNGRSVLVLPFLCDSNLPVIEVRSNTEYIPELLEITELKSIYEQ